MSEETYRPQRRDIPVDNPDTAIGPKPNPEGPPVQISGNIPPALAAAMAGQAPPARQTESYQQPQYQQPQYQAAPQNPQNSVQNLMKNHELDMSTAINVANSDFMAMMGLLDPKNVYIEVTMPSLGKFYNGVDGPSNGVVNLRPMTGEEEQFLATNAYVKKNDVITRIFNNCIKESYDTDNFLSYDRTFLLIYLRAISYSKMYEVEIKCPICDNKFGATIDLELPVDYCPESFTENQFESELPTSKFKFKFRFSRGRDEMDIFKHKQQRTKMSQTFGKDLADDTLIYRSALLTDYFKTADGSRKVQNKEEIIQIIKRLPMSDVSYIRNQINEPPFGVNTDIELTCPQCTETFDSELPLDIGFFFPRQTKKKE